MYLTIEEIFARTEAAISAAEAHGIATGMLSINSMITARAWLQEVFASDVNLSDSDRVQLVSLFEKTQKLLNTETFEFELFLPDEDIPLTEKVDALRHWCLGYLSGIGFTHSDHDWSEDSSDMLKDIVEFTHVDINAEGEEDEFALAELHEYIRVGVQVIKEEFSVAGSSAALH